MFLIGRNYLDSLNSILIIDDDDDDLFLIEDRLAHLTNEDCIFVHSSEKQASINLLKERTFDLCILDYRLAGYEGLEILEAVADAELATPIIMLTGQNDDDVAKQAIRSGAQDFVMKSMIDEDVFEKSIRYAIARKELEFARVLSNRNQAENVAKDKFIAHLSHELRTPLTSILGYTSLLLENPDTASFYNELNIISNNGKHLLNLLNDVLDLSKIVAGKFELKETPTNLQQLIIEVNSLLSVSALDKGLSLEFSSLTQLPEIVTLDELRFRQVMVNLIGNAIKFTDEGKIQVSISMLNKQTTPKLCINIVDSGIGMPEHKVKDIFSPFSQIEDVADRKAGGAGLGLSITAEIVKKMGGELKVVSKLNQGSTFTLQIPCKAESSKLIDYDFTMAFCKKASSSAPQLSGRVLIVDDVFEIRQLAGYFIKETGVDVEFARNGQQALEIVTNAIDAQKPIDLIFMDLHMPVLTGEETVRLLRKNGNDCRIIAMTAAISKGLQKKLVNAGFNKLISKPLDKYEMWRVLSSALKPANKTDAVQSELLNASSAKAMVHLVEDDIDSANIMQLILKQLGYQVQHSSTAQAAILKSKEDQSIAFHLLDLGLPDLQGEAFLSAFFAHPVSGKVCILSGNQPETKLFKQFPITDHLVKPISKEGLEKWLQAQS